MSADVCVCGHLRGEHEDEEAPYCVADDPDNPDDQCPCAYFEAVDADEGRTVGRPVPGDSLDLWIDAVAALVPDAALRFAANGDPYIVLDGDEDQRWVLDVRLLPAPAEGDGIGDPT